MQDVTLALDLPLRVDAQLRRATGWGFDERRRIVIDREAGESIIGSERTAVGPGEVLDVAEGWCVAPATLGRWLGVGFELDQGQAVLRLVSPRPLPFEEALERRARAGRARDPAIGAARYAALPRITASYEGFRAPAIDVNAIVGFARSAPGGDSSERVLASYELYASGEVAGASVDARLASDRSGAPQSLRVRAYRYDPEGRLLGPLKATYAAAGDVVGYATPIVGSVGSGRGAVVTNRPTAMPDSFDRTRFDGDLPSGWDVELYRNGQLIAAQTVGPDGRYRFEDVRLLFGVNRFEIIGYGPQGQQRRRVETFNIGAGAVLPGRLHYWMTAFDAGRDLILWGRRSHDPTGLRGNGWRFGAGAEYGLDRRTSLGAWATSFVAGDQRVWNVEASLRRSVGGSLVEASAAAQKEGMALRGAWAGPIGRSGAFSLQTLHSMGEFRIDPLIDDGIRFEHRANIDLSPRIGSLTLPLSVEGRWERSRAGIDRRHASVNVSGVWRRLAFTTGVRWSSQRTMGASARSPAVGAGVSQEVAELVALANWRAGGWRIRGEGSATIARRGDAFGPPARGAIVAERALSERGDVRGELAFDGRWRIAAGYQHRFDRFALSGQVEAAADGAVAASLALSFSVGPDPIAGGYRMARERLASSGQVVAELFIDDNGNGRRDLGEEAAPGVEVGGSAQAAVASDAKGMVLLDGIAPYAPTPVVIDETMLPSPLVRPAVHAQVVVARPGVAMRISVPLVPTGEVEAWLRDPGGGSVAHAQVALVDQAGQIRAETRSDFDGLLLFERVPYGRYQLRVVDSGWALASEVGVELNAAHPSEQLGTVVLERRSSSQALAAAGALRNGGGGH